MVYAHRFIRRLRYAVPTVMHNYAPALRSMIYCFLLKNSTSKKNLTIKKLKKLIFINNKILFLWRVNKKVNSMKTVKYLLITITLLFSNISYIQAQSTEGKDFWLTFGSLGFGSSDMLDMQIRIVGGNLKTEVNIYFTNLGTSVQFEIDPYEVFTHNLDTVQRAAAHNTVTGGDHQS